VERRIENGSSNQSSSQLEIRSTQASDGQGTVPVFIHFSGNDVGISHLTPVSRFLIDAQEDRFCLAQRSKQGILISKKGEFMVPDIGTDRVTLRDGNNLRRKIGIIAVIFRWVGVLLLICGAVGFIMFLGNEKLWSDATVLMAGVGLVAFVPYFIVTWSFLRGGVKLTKLEPRARRDAIISAIGGLVLVSLWGLRAFWASALFGGHNPLIIIIVWVSITSLFTWALIVLCSKNARVTFAEASQDSMGDSPLAAGVEKQEAVSLGSEMERVLSNTRDATPLTTTNGSHPKDQENVPTAVTARKSEINGQNSTKPKISARAVIQDIEMGLDDMALMQKYGLSAKQLVSLYQRLEAAGLMKKQ
jgi:hypothetical protein